MLRCNLSGIIGDSCLKIEDIYRGTGLYRTIISKLYHDKMERLDYETLSKLCSFLECQVDDILEYYEKRYYKLFTSKTLRVFKTKYCF